MCCGTHKICFIAAIKVLDFYIVKYFQPTENIEQSLVLWHNCMNISNAWGHSNPQSSLPKQE